MPKDRRTEDPSDRERGTFDKDRRLFDCRIVLKRYAHIQSWLRTCGPVKVSCNRFVWLTCHYILVELSTTTLLRVFSGF